MVTSNRSLVLIPVLASLVLTGIWLLALPGTDQSAKSLVVYCAHDAMYATEVLDEFTRQTGIRVQTRFDTEATKSLGLINLIIQERQQPRCDVFWNNELLGMVELQEQGLLEPYQGSGWRRMPEQFRDHEGYWVGFAARLRVYVVNTNQVSADESSLASILSLEPARFAMAKPLFGTTLTHYTVLWHLWGSDRLKGWHHDVRQQGMREVDGNAAVKDIVARGTCDAGMTDSDDVFVALDDGLPVDLLPVRIIENHITEPPPTSALGNFTICIPNTVGIIRGTARRDAARQLVDFFTSAETEQKLAQSKSRQIPLGPIETTLLPEDVRRLAEWSRDGYDLRPLLPARRACLEWLRAEYLK